MTSGARFTGEDRRFRSLANLWSPCAYLEETRKLHWMISEWSCRRTTAHRVKPDLAEPVRGRHRELYATPWTDGARLGVRLVWFEFDKDQANPRVGSG